MMKMILPGLLSGLGSFLGRYWPFILIILGIIIGLAVIKYILYGIFAVIVEPHLNALGTIAFIIFMIVKVPIGSRELLIALYLIPFLDCIQDLVISHHFKDGADTISNYSMSKGFITLFTAGLARIVYFLIVLPKIRLRASSSLKEQLEAGGEIVCPDYGKSSWVPMRYYFMIHVDDALKMGTLKSSVRVAQFEERRRSEKLEALYPKKFLEKMTEKFGGNKEIQELRDKTEEKIKEMRKKDSGHLDYLPTVTYEKLPSLIGEAMAAKSFCPLAEIKYFPEVQSLGLTEPLSEVERVEAGYERPRDMWLNHFIVMALEPLVQSGDFEHGDFNDRDPLDNHAYRYTKSTKAMVSQSPETNPALALDDDD